MTSESRWIVWLERLEKAGDRLPHPAWLFLYFLVLVMAFSLLGTWFGWSAVHPVSGEQVTTNNLLSRDGVQWFITHMVKNFTGFAPLGTVLVAMLGLGIAERSGLMSALLRQLVLIAPERLLTFVVVFAGVQSSLAADAGYVVLIPIAAMLFAQMGRSPLLGIAAAFAGVSGGYSANLLIGPLDAILAGISTEAIQGIAEGYEVLPTANYYFILASTALVAIIGTWVTEAILARRFTDPEKSSGAALTTESGSLNVHEKRGLAAVGWMTLATLAVLLIALVPETGWLRHSETGSIIRSPFTSGIVVLIALYAGLAGILYGRVTRAFESHRDIVAAMETSMSGMAGYLVLMFFAAQFVAAFQWTDLGVILAITGADGLAGFSLGPVTLLVGFVLMAALINLLIGSASAKWVLIAPVFVPMFYLLDVSPEATQLAYRIGDSSTNIITPLMPYYGVVLAFVQRYQPAAGVGTLMAMMLPYSVALLLGWLSLLILWMLLGLPLGF